MVKAYVLEISKHMKKQDVKEINICGVSASHPEGDERLRPWTSPKEGGCLSDMVSDGEAVLAQTRSRREYRTADSLATMEQVSMTYGSCSLISRTRIIMIERMRKTQLIP